MEPRGAEPSPRADGGRVAARGFARGGAGADAKLARKFLRGANRRRAGADHRGAEPADVRHYGGIGAARGAGNRIRFRGRQKPPGLNGLVKFGLTSNLELRVTNNPFERDATVGGTGDSGAGFKWRFLRQRSRAPTLALLYTAIFPTADHGLGFRAYGHSVQLLASKDFGQHHFDLNEGVQFLGRPAPATGGYDRNYFTSLSWSHPVRGKWGFTAEAAGFSRTNAAMPATMTLLFAPTYNASSRFVLDAGTYIAAYGNLPRATFFCGLTYSLADLYRMAHREHLTHPGRP